MARTPVAVKLAGLQHPVETGSVSEMIGHFLASVFSGLLSPATLRLPGVRAIRTAAGHRFNASKVVCRSVRRAIAEKFFGDRKCSLPRWASSRRSETRLPRQCGADAKCVVVIPSFDWKDDRPSNPLAESVILRSPRGRFTKLGNVPKENQGVLRSLCAGCHRLA